MFTLCVHEAKFLFFIFFFNFVNCRKFCKFLRKNFGGVTFVSLLG